MATATVAFAPFVVAGRAPRASRRAWRPTRCRPTTRFTRSSRWAARCRCSSSRASNPGARREPLSRARARGRRRARLRGPHRPRGSGHAPRRSAPQSVVILNDTRPPSGAAGRALALACSAGAGLFVAAGERSTWPTRTPTCCPASSGAPVDRSGTTGGTLGYVDFSHPAFEIFRSPRSGDLTAARIFRYRTLVGARAGREVARFDDGAVAVAERKVGRGTVARVDLDVRQLLERPAAQAGVRAVRASGHAAPRALRRAAAVVHGRRHFDPRPDDRPAGGIRAAGRQPLVTGARTRTPPGDGGRRRRRAHLRADGDGVLRDPSGRGTAGDASSWRSTRRRRVGPLADRSGRIDGGRDSAAAAGAAAGAGADHRRGRERRQSLWWYLLAAGLSCWSSRPRSPAGCRGLRDVMATTPLTTNCCASSGRSGRAGAGRSCCAASRCWSAPAILALLAAAYGLEQFRFSPASIVVFRVVMYVVLVALGWFFFVRPLGRRVSDQQVALYLEEHEPSLQEILLSAVDVGAPAAPSSGPGESAALLRQLVEVGRRALPGHGPRPGPRAPEPSHVARRAGGHHARRRARVRPRAGVPPPGRASRCWCPSRAPRPRARTAST